MQRIRARRVKFLEVYRTKPGIWRPTYRQRAFDFRIDGFCIRAECCSRSVKRRAFWEERMKRFAMAASLVISACSVASAQTTDQLVKGATDTSNVLNYGMGYNLQRFSTLNQINKDTVKNLVPVWNYSFNDDRSEESQPLVYQGVIYVTSHNATMAVDAKTGKQIWKSKIEYPAETPRIVCCGIINRGAALYRRQAVPHHARRQRDRDRCQGRQGAVAAEGGRHQGRLFDDGGAAGRRRRRHHRHLRRRVRHPRLHRRLGSGNGQASLAHPFDPLDRTSPAATPGRATPGSSAAARPGSRAPTIPS